jgi:hypothetical protein
MSRSVMSYAIFVLEGFEFSEKISTLVFFLKGMDNAHLPIKLNEIFDVMNGGILMKSKEFEHGGYLHNRESL